MSPIGDYPDTLTDIKMTTIRTVNQGLDRLLSKYNMSQIRNNTWLLAAYSTLVDWKAKFGGNYFLPEPQKFQVIVDTGELPEAA